MKLYILIVAYSCFSLYLSAEYDPDFDMVDSNFYSEPRFEHEGHLWRPILMQHHEECHCKLAN